MAQLQILEEGNAIIVPLEIKLGKLLEYEEIVARLRKAEKDLPPGAVPETPRMHLSDTDETPSPAIFPDADPAFVPETVKPSEEKELGPIANLGFKDETQEKPKQKTETDRLLEMLERQAVGLGKQQQTVQDESIKAGIEKFMEEGPQMGDFVNVIQMSKNPMGFMIKLINNPYVAAAIAVIAIGAIIYELYTVQGGIFDLYFKRIVVDEFIKGREREAKQAIRIGLGRSVVITTRSGTNTPESSFNSFEAVRSGEMESIKSFQIRKGYMF